MYADKQVNQGYAQAGGYIGGAVLGAASQYAGEAVRKPEVEAEMNQLAESLEMLAQVTESMCIRLEPVRRKTGLANGSQTSAPKPVQCALASSLRDRRESVERCIAQLQGATSELEI
jgi:hypothetical protein